MQANASDAPEASILLAGTDPRLAAFARQVAAHAVPLLAASNARLLSLTIESRQRAIPVTMCWNGAAQPVCFRSALLCDEVTVRRARAGFEQAGKRLLMELVCRWPTNAVPPAIGIVTDGGGVVFSSDHPSPLCPDWLALHQAGRCAPTTLRAFADAGAWLRLTAPVGDHRIH